MTSFVGRFVGVRRGYPRGVGLIKLMIQDIIADNELVEQWMVMDPPLGGVHYLGHIPRGEWLGWVADSLTSRPRNMVRLGSHTPDAIQETIERGVPLVGAPNVLDHFITGRTIVSYEFDPEPTPSSDVMAIALGVVKECNEELPPSLREREPEPVEQNIMFPFTAGLVR